MGKAGSFTKSCLTKCPLLLDQVKFLRQDSVKRFSKSLADLFEEVLATMKNGVVKQFGENGLSVVLTGGGASLPMVKELAHGAHSVCGIQIHKNEVPPVPEEYESDTELAVVYPQLAVAIGGTMPVIIDEKAAVEDMNIPRGQFTLDRSQVTGM